MASNSGLKRNLERQVEIYMKANETRNDIEVIVYYTEAEELKVGRKLKDLEVSDSESMILIDARAENKPSGSMA